jgi:hypothetical protein
MKFNKLKTRRGKLGVKLKQEFPLLNETELENVLLIIDSYEKDNLATIEKLKKVKLVDTKKINGALKQTIKAHGPITMVLIGSATKRIYGALLDTVKPTETKINKILKWLRLT